MKAEILNLYQAKINYHRVDDLTENALPNGSIIHVRACYYAEDDERFAGDIIFLVAENLQSIPERDIEILKEITHKEYRRHWPFK